MPGFKNISGKAGDYSVEKQKNFTETYKKKEENTVQVHVRIHKYTFWSFNL